MTQTREILAPLAHPDKFFIDGEWVSPSSSEMIDVLDSNDEELYFSVPAAQAADIDAAVTAAHRAFHEGPWPRLTHERRAEYLRDMAGAIRRRSDVLADLWSRESGQLYTTAKMSGAVAGSILDYYAGLAIDFPWEEVPEESGGTFSPGLAARSGFSLIVREPVGVVAVIVAWNGPLQLALVKLVPALLAGCTVVIKSPPEAPGSAYIIAEAASKIGLPEGVINVVTADRDVSELLVRDPRIDKVAMTGSTATGRRIASIMGERIGRYTLELGGKSAAIVLDDADISETARVLANAECRLSGQVCASLTRIIVGRHRHDEFVDALSSVFAEVRVGNAFDPTTQLGPLASARQRERVEGYIAQGIAQGAKLTVGGGRPKDLNRGYFIEPTVFGNVDNSYSIAQEEIFGPVLSVIPADGEDDAVRIANDSIYGLNASVFSKDVDRVRGIARQLRSGTVGHNGYRVDFGLAFGGFKQSGVGREGGREGLLAYLETKVVVLDEAPSEYRDA